jgi:hypothetical protein
VSIDAANPNFMIPRIRRTLAALLALAGLSAAPPAVAQEPVVIRGTVADSTGTPVQSVTVRITRHPQNDAAATQTGSAGTFTLTFPPGATEYYVLVSGPGWKPFRTRIAPDPPNPAWSRLSVRLLAADPVVLAPVTVRAVRAPPGRDMAMGPGVGAAEAPVEGVAASLAPTEAGELAAMAATVPGVVRTGEGFSVLGLDPSQNRATLNGMEFAGSSLPRDLAARTRVATSAYDPARGGFSGAEVAVEVAPGSAYTLGNASLSTGGSPFSSGGDATQPNDFRAGVGRNGELSPERLYYSAGAQVNRQSRDAISIESASAEALAGAGVSPAAAAQLEQVLSSLGISPGAAGGTATTDELALMARVDHTPLGPRSWGATAYANAGRSDAVPGLTSTAASGVRRRWATLALQGEHSRLIGRFHRNDTRTSLSVSTRAVEPLFALPGGRVEVEGDVPGSVASLGFGGGSADARGRRWSWQATNETRWNDSENRHQRKVYLESLLEGFDDADATGTRGFFTFRSLDDLAAGRGATYSRRLGSTRAEGVQWNGALALGDSWRVSPRLRVMGGVRLDANRFLTAPAENPGVQEAFGVRTGYVPSGWGLSPRLGFNWSPRRRLPTPGIRFSPLGSRGETPVGLVRGGVGVFRGRHAVEALSGPLLATGLSGEADEIRCLGPAVPAADWTGAGASLPARCADGGGAFADSTPRVELFAPGFSPPRSVRGNLAWSSRVGWLGYTVEALYSLNLDQPGTVDLNFAGAPRFVLSSEAGRPVYVAPSGIDPATGFAAPGEARRDPAYGSVRARRSDLRSESRQLTVSLAPELPDRYWLGLGYTLAGSHAQFRGFDGAALGDPSAAEWAPGRFDARHQLQLQAGWRRSHLSVGLYARFTSGLPYTPVVAGDVNGDGRAGDRAFVFDPAVAPAGVAEGIRALLASAPGGARDCLRGQLGRAAGRGSCRGPWTQHSNLRFSYGSPNMRGARLRDRTSLQVAVENPLGGVDRLVHGRAGIRGWGAAASPDPVLLRVTGFDAAAQAFRYSVNPRFGSTRAHAAAPVRVTVQLSLAMGAPVERQQLQLHLRPGRGAAGARITAETLQRRYARNVPDVYDRILAMSDSLVLSGEQLQALRAAQAPYRARVDSVWAGLAAYLAALPEKYDVAEAVRRQEEATDRAWDLNRGQGPAIRAILSPFQIQMADWIVIDALGGVRPGKPRLLWQ